MYRRDDPRFRRTINQVTSTLETSAETAQIGLFSFTEHYLKPCFGSISESLQPCLQSFQPCLDSCAGTLDPCIATCFPGYAGDRRAGVRGRSRTNTRGRLEHSFDFYDDWAEDENDALLALDDDEFDRVVGRDNGMGSSGYLTDASNTRPEQPGKRNLFKYGAAAANTGQGPLGTRPRSRRKSSLLAQDPAGIPNQSAFGFLNKLPFALGQRPNLKYKPSAADLQVRSSTGDFVDENEEGAGPDDDDVEEGHPDWKGHGRKRSGTQSSRATTDSLSSRGDLFPSDEEGDAVPFDDEFTLPLDRQRSIDDASSGKTRGSGRTRRPSSNRKTSSTKSAKSNRAGKKNKTSNKTSRSNSSGTSKSEADIEEPEMGQLPTIDDLKLEEQEARQAEEEDVERKRDAAQKLALEKGLTPDRGVALSLSTSDINVTQDSQPLSVQTATSTSTSTSDVLDSANSRDDGG